MAAAYAPGIGMAFAAYELYRNNPFNDAHHNAGLSGQYLAILVKELNVFNDNSICIFSFSLGTLFTFRLLNTLYDLGGSSSVGDVCMMGSVVDFNAFYNNAHKLIGPSGVIRGKLYILHSKYDKVLKYLFRMAKIGSFPIGLKALNYAKLSDSLLKNDSKLMGWTKE